MPRRLLSTSIIRSGPRAKNIKPSSWLGVRSEASTPCLQGIIREVKKACISTSSTFALMRPSALGLLIGLIAIDLAMNLRKDSKLWKNFSPSMLRRKPLKYEVPLFSRSCEESPDRIVGTQRWANIPSSAAFQHHDEVPFANFFEISARGRTIY